jgi:hypothetical protein
VRVKKNTHERSLDDDIAEIVVYEDSENELTSSDSDSSYSDDETDVHVAINPPDSSPIYLPLLYLSV